PANSAETRRQPAEMYYLLTGDERIVAARMPA
ncbi:hypothetical protein LCGC14_2938710, partial [marine sediment metagenome]